MLELQLRDIEVRLTVAEIDADLEALRVKHGELAEDGLAGGTGLVAAVGPGARRTARAGPLEPGREAGPRTPDRAHSQMMRITGPKNRGVQAEFPAFPVRPLYSVGQFF